MKIIEAFKENPDTKDIVIIINNKQILFRAVDIGSYIKINNIRSVIRNYDDHEKILCDYESKGGKQQTIFLTKDGLYKLLTRSKKAEASILKKSILNIFEKNIKEDKEQLIKEKQTLEDELNNVKSKLELRQKKKFSRGETVYIYEDVITNTNQKVYKVGYSGDMNTRLSSYESNRFDDNLKYTVNCCNGRLLESVMHHILRKYVDPNKKEWFHTSFEIVKNTLETTCLFLDNLININANDSYIIENLEEITKILKNIQENVTDDESNKDESNKVPITKNKSKPATCEEIQSKISQFIEECCILEDNACEQTYLINARYRLWVKRHTALEESKALNKYLDDKFPKTRIWNKVTKTAQLSVKGIRLNDKPYYFPNNPPNEYDKFIEDMCIVYPGARVPLCYIVDDFMKWKSDNNLPTLHRKKEHISLYKYFIQFFVPVNGYIIYHGKKESGAIYGLTLKSNPDLNLCHAGQGIVNRKKVYKIDPKTNKVIETFDSVTELGHKLKADSYYIMHKNSPYKGFLYSYNPP